MALNQMYTWAAGGGANALTNSAYYALPTLRAQGFLPGVASSEQVNTVLRQTSTVAAAVGGFVAQAGIDVLDNGDSIALRDAITAAVRHATRNIVPVGTVITSYRTTAPEGYLPLAGGMYLRSAYPELFAAASADGLVVSEELLRINPANSGKFSSGDGVTNFRVPDLRGMHIRYLDGGRGVDLARQMASYQEDQLATHAHLYRMGMSTDGGRTAGGGDPNMASTWTDFGSTSNEGGGGETRVKTIALMAYIKY